MKYPTDSETKFWSLLLALAVLATIARAQAPQSPIPAVSSVPAELRKQYNLSPFYQKYLDANGLPVLGSTNVSDYAMREAVWIITHMLGLHPEVLQVMGTNGGRLVVMAYNEYTTDLPEQADRKPKIFQDRRSRGLGGRVCSCAEENLLCYPKDPYSTENILVHEFGHAIAGVGMRAIDPTFNERLRAAYRKATAAGLWKGTYAGSNPAEYWAEAVQDWFDNNRTNDAQHNSVGTRAQLKEYDPDVAALCNEVFGEVEWRYKKPMERAPAGRAHLAGFDPAKSPTFKWRKYPVSETPRIVFQTAIGELEAELYTTNAPYAVTNLLTYMLDGYFRNGEFFRVVTSDNQQANEPKLQGIQVRADPSKDGERFPRIPLERTRDTVTGYSDGALVMVSDGADTARDSFFICLGAQPSQGVAPFGKVIRGMDLVRKIQELPASGQMLTPPLRIQGAYRME